MPSKKIEGTFEFSIFIPINMNGDEKQENMRNTQSCLNCHPQNSNNMNK